VLARFIPVVRTVLNPLAGMAGVPARTFTIWQVAGGQVWSVGVILAGYTLGSHLNNADRYLLPIIAVIIVVSLIPIAVELWRARRTAVTARPPRHRGGRPPTQRLRAPPAAPRGNPLADAVELLQALAAPVRLPVITELETATGQDGTTIDVCELRPSTDLAAAAFAGSPTILLDGQDLPGPAPVTDLTCRLYATELGLQGSPSVEALTAALSERGKRQR
jgi:hypothetical protein